MATQNLNLALQPIILDIDDTTSQIATLLAAQTNDQERYALAEKIIIELLNKNKEQKKTCSKRRTMSAKTCSKTTTNYFMSKKTCYMKEKHYLP